MSNKKNIVVFGKGRSGTNAYSEMLSHSYPGHNYLKEYFNQKWVLSDNFKIISANNASTGLLDIDYKLQQINSIINRSNILFNITSYHINDDILDFINKNCNLHLIKRRNTLETFLSHIIAWFEDSFYANKVNRKPDSIFINQAMFTQYLEYHKKYKFYLNKINPVETVWFEDLNLSTTTYKSSYNLNKLDYIENKKEVLEFIRLIESI